MARLVPLVITLCGFAPPVAAAPPTPGSPPPARSLAIRGATLIDGTGRPPLANACVVMEGGRITAVGPLGRVRVPAGARLITAPKGATLLPGLIDMHVHTTVHAGLMPYFLANGVTSVRDLGCGEDQLPSLKRYRDEAPAGKQIGPRLFLAGPPLDGLPRAASWFPGPGARDPAGAVAGVTSLADAGVDVVKLYRRLDIASARAAIAEAHRRNLPVTWDYQWNSRYLENAIRSGVDGLEHVYYSERSARDESDRLAESIAAGRIWLDPTLVAFRPPERAVTHDPDFRQLPASLTRFWSRLFWPMETDAEFESMKAFVRKVHRSGGRLLAGTDSPVKYVAPGYALHQELQLLAACSLTPMEAIQVATRNAAQALRREKELGTVEPGKRADLALVLGDPLKDLRATRKVYRVVLDGRVYDPQALVRQAQQAAPPDSKPLPPYVHGE